jgi:hypothetical protein
VAVAQAVERDLGHSDPLSQFAQSDDTVLGRWGPPSNWGTADPAA